MPNGKGFAQCGECLNFVADRKQHCKKHNFDFPLILIGYEFLCKDYAPAYNYSEKPSNEMQSLEAGNLFYYCCQGERNYKKLEKFTELENAIYGIHLLDDRRYKWLFEVKDYQKDLWDSKSIILRHDSKSENFIRRKLTKEMFTSYTFATKSVLYASQLIDVYVPEDKNSEFLNDIVENFIGLNRYQYKMKTKEEFLCFGISIFLKKMENSVYNVMQDSYFKDFFEKLG